MPPHPGSYFVKLKIMYTVPCKGNPCDLLTEDKARGHEQLGKVLDLDSLLFVSLELDTGRCEHVDGVLGIHVFSEGVEGGCVNCSRFAC